MNDKCPKYRTEVTFPTKTWTLAPKGRKLVTIGLFKCPNCDSYFRAE
ncbi:MAG: chromatin protein Cren7 [Candidatus Verstraetearchaeota archaeon]|nr:chromatin protein Cren7 [Candidatus Verstraetearchaeota archaeon]